VVSPFKMKARLEAEIIVMRHQLTDHPTAEWIAWQIAEAFPWDEALTISFATATPATVMPSGDVWRHRHPASASAR
jgi:hypothetical protein